MPFQRDILDLQQVYVGPAAGGEARVLAESNRVDIDGLAWTGDDRDKLLGGQQLRRVSASGGEEAPIVIAYVPGPVLSPSLHGSRLAYVKAWDNTNIRKLDLRDPSVASGTPAKLISSTRRQAAASFSSDGSQIVFQSDRSGAWEIWKSNRDGSDATQLTHFQGPLTGTPPWSPDGRQIAFDSRVSGRSEIYIVAADGGVPRQLTSNPAGNPCRHGRATASGSITPPAGMGS